ncbi:JDVT-CTERM system glutamic-type intramembrane protease [Simiduia sp. 21SJ11W-1]|uniref:JDVT-CTERM system glutamic-type intramembrane protease MrtJ n=1 Tax=Simiduia sp. 21SJ11W-1 TaxID=2909669 RepID=UPI0020A1F8AC|nr:JDVT-CTERM system glutamic-type intramembrane protease [Simiduia sp. 21SJ11W-1]UTA47217.1 JDVT-CTERM system glutamic-type intramembrane protease [Simiduia sp. 21SJ11W-1]
MFAHNNFWQDKHWATLALAGSLVAVVAGLIIAPMTATLSAIVLWVAVYPIVEEYVFRGMLQPLIARHWPQRWRQLSIANLLTSGVFTLAHVATKGVHPLSLGVFFPSLLFGYFRERHENLLSPMALHALFNAVFFATALLAG